METNKPLTRAGYLLSLLLVITPFVDAAGPLLPLRLSDERWRWGAVGQLSNIVLVPLLGLLLIIAIASLTDARRIRRVTGAICAILAVVLGALSVLFILDYFQVRTVVKPQFQHAMAVACTMALVKNVLSIITLALLSRAGFAGPKASVVRKVAPPSQPSSTPLIPVPGGARAE